MKSKFDVYMMTRLENRGIVAIKGGEYRLLPGNNRKEVFEDLIQFMRESYDLETEVQITEFIFKNYEFDEYKSNSIFIKFIVWLRGRKDNEIWCIKEWQETMMPYLTDPKIDKAHEIIKLLNA